MTEPNPYGPVLRRCQYDDFPVRDEEYGCPRGCDQRARARSAALSKLSYESARDGTDDESNRFFITR
ncbi:hypothetical protein ABZ215_24950 [Amycolatopsis sp. NPDC006131]|uniref:hypothetical protein n=1 Tax=Amycolatopsis sp. NPDC006131 TaxID=3156731 RepID=UPI0033BC4A68